SQVALFTFRIKEMSEHLKQNKKDHACRRSLLSLVGKRKRLLNYLAKKDIQAYRDLIEKLGLRK
ncbi:MAG: 30S ribosomal protein S15, partial [Bacteroidota bacterium]